MKLGLKYYVQSLAYRKPSTGSVVFYVRFVI